MKIPMYVQDLMERSEFALGYGDPGYTIVVHKRTYHQLANTFSKEIKKLEKWANRQVPHYDDIPIAKIIKIPEKTHYRDQTATITIYDPVMKQIERYMKKK